MILFRVRDMMSVLFWRACGPMFGAFGKNVRVVRPRYIDGMRHIRIGDGTILQEGAYVTIQPDAANIFGLSIGKGSMIGHRAHMVVTHEVAIGENVLIADNVFITDCSHRYADPEAPILSQGLERRGPVSIGEGSWIGENAVVVGARIGRHCVVGAHAVVLHDVPDYSVVAGQPATIVKRYCMESGSWIRSTRNDATGMERV